MSASPSTGRTPVAASTEYERSLPSERRRAEGIHYTPEDLARRLTAVALEGMVPGPVCDPACGAGVWLLAAAGWLAGAGVDRRVVATELLWGADTDARAVAMAREAIRVWSGGAEPGGNLVVADGLELPAAWQGRFAAVLGNPPFGGQLRGSTVRGQRRGPDGSPYADTAALFLLAAGALARRDDGRVLMIQPQSVLAARDAAAVRAALGVPRGLWWGDSGIFSGASIATCAVLVDRGRRSGEPVRRWRGRSVEELAPAAAPEGNWAELLGTVDLPAWRPAPRAPALGTLATATAGFRQHFYGLAPYVVEDAGPSAPRLVTSGLIDPGADRWGSRPARFAGRRYQRPVVDVDRLARDGRPDVAAWVRARLRPKVLVAAQTRIVEAAPDPAGDAVPSVPVVSVEPLAAGPDATWLVAAALLAPPVSAWAVARQAGTGRASGTIRLPASVLLAAPLPSDARAWPRASRLLRDGDVAAAARLMTAAHGAGEDVFEWWRSHAAPHLDRYLS